MTEIVVTIPDFIVNGLNSLHVIRDEFEKYKTSHVNLALSNSLDPEIHIPAPSKAYQLDNTPIHEFFGRDKAFDRPDSLVMGQFYHVHLNLDPTKWDSNTKRVEQWNCVSDATAIYRYIPPEYTEKHHFLLLMVLPSGAHQAYSDPKTTSYLLNVSNRWKMDNIKII